MKFIIMSLMLMVMLAMLCSAQSFIRTNDLPLELPETSEFEQNDTTAPEEPNTSDLEQPDIPLRFKRQAFVSEDRCPPGFFVIASKCFSCEKYPDFARVREDECAWE